MNLFSHISYLKNVRKQIHTLEYQMPFVDYTVLFMVIVVGLVMTMIVFLINAWISPFSSGQ